MLPTTSDNIRYVAFPFFPEHFTRYRKYKPLFFDTFPNYLFILEWNVRVFETLFLSLIIVCSPAVKDASSKLPFFGVFCLPIQICLLGVRGPGPGLPALLPGVRCPGFQGFRGPCGQTSRLSGGFQRARLPPGARGQGPEGQGPASLVFFRICSYHFIFYF